MIKELQNWKGKTKLKFNHGFNNFYDEMNYLGQNGNFHFEEDPINKHAQGIVFIMHEVMVFLKYSQTKPQVKNKNIIYFDLCHTMIKNLSKEGGERWNLWKINASFFSNKVEDAKWKLAADVTFLVLMFI